MKSRSLKRIIKEQSEAQSTTVAPVLVPLIKQAAETHKQQKALTEGIQARLQTIAADAKLDLSVVNESVTHLLANIVNVIEQRQPIKIMHLNAVASFLAGVELIATTLPTMENPSKKANTLRALAVAGLDGAGSVNDATFPIISLGADNSALRSKYIELFQQYASEVARGGDVNSAELLREIKQARVAIEKAMLMTR